MERTSVNFLKVKIKLFLLPIKLYFNRGGQLTLLVKRNILFSFLAKLASNLLSFVSIPIIISYLGATNYGVWVTFFSILSLIAVFDFGVANSSKNSITKALASEKISDARHAIGKLYISLMLLAAILIAVSTFLMHADISLPQMIIISDNRKAIYILVLLFIFQFVLKAIDVVFASIQKNYLSGMMNALSNLFIIIFALNLGNRLGNDPAYWGIAIIGSSILTLFSFSTFFYLFNRSSIVLNFSDIKLGSILYSIGLGKGFFVIQVSSIIIFSTDNIIINHFIGPQEVAVYSLAYKYFGLIPMFFNMLLNPFWTAYTHSFQNNEIDWIRRATKKLLYLWAIGVALVLFMLLISPVVYKIWLSGKISIPFSLSCWLAILFSITIWNAIFSLFTNGTGKIKLQMYISLITSILNIPMAYFLGVYFNFGVIGIIASNCICLLISSILIPVQYKKIVNGSALGVWNK